jgi:hypothetical protein
VSARWDIRANSFRHYLCQHGDVQYTVSAELIETFSVFVAPEMEGEKIDLIRAGLVTGVIARPEYPKLEIEACAARLEQVARRVAAWVPDCHSQSALAPSTP